MELKLCSRCKRPYLAGEGSCPNCPEPYTWNQESRANLGCLLLMLLPILFVVLFWLFLFIGLFVR